MNKLPPSKCTLARKTTNATQHTQPRKTTPIDSEQKLTDLKGHACLLVAGREYEQCIRYNLTLEEQSIAVDIISMIKVRSYLPFPSSPQALFSHLLTSFSPPKKTTSRSRKRGELTGLGGRDARGGGNHCANSAISHASLHPTTRTGIPN